MIVITAKRPLRVGVQVRTNERTGSDDDGKAIGADGCDGVRRIAGDNRAGAK
jgi:hypothetical protein